MIIHNLKINCYSIRYDKQVLNEKNHLPIFLHLKNSNLFFLLLYNFDLKKNIINRNEKKIK